MTEMKCEEDKSLITRWVMGELTPAERSKFEQHLALCPSCAAELKSEQQLWQLMDAVPAPQAPADMTARFNGMLEEYKQTQQARTHSFARLLARIRELWSVQPGLQLAYTLILVVAGLGIGLLVSRPGADRQEFVALKKEMKDMKEMMMLSLLENPSASERIRGVSYTSEIKRANKEVIDALLSTLNNDPNVNVRLVTLEALTQYSNEPAVREGLVQSIVKQDSPLVQVALADAMLKLQEKRSVQPFRKLLEQKDLDHTIRKKLEQTITSLI